MFRKHLLFLLAFSLGNVCFSQNQHEYFGAIILSDSISITCKINISEKDGEVKGYSLTDLGGEQETRSNIFGEYDKNKKELSFRETGIVYTKSPISQNDFCFMNVTIKNFVFGKTTQVKTKFLGLFYDNTKCISGELFFNAIEKVEARLSKVSKKIEKTNRISDSIKEKINPIKIMDSLNMNILRKNQTLSVFTKAKKINLIIYDGGKQDGDKITIIANGKVILNSYQADKTKRIIPIEINNNKMSIIIKANNEGSISPNTVVVEIDDNSNYIKALSNLKVNETTQIDILKE
ncbi:hypothetical protein [Mariniflexile sp. HMF6888]|uniref:hypothetical protein n=1 Tax=Mariniflexile sp. HMF6888 TaxID=3373086 RepID=UPI0037B7E308